jgi:hypothetical protein
MNPGNYLALGWALALVTGANALAAPGPVLIQAPADFDEGTETVLTVEQVDQIRDWISNRKLDLENLLKHASSLSYEEQKLVFYSGIRNAVSDSGGVRSETLMRFVLNRALKIVDEIGREADVSQPGILDQQVRIMKLSVRIALRYHESDLAYLSGQTRAPQSALVNLPYAQFGVEYAVQLMQMMESVPDASAQYTIAIMAVGLLQWDLYRDASRARYAPAIGTLKAFLDLMPEKAGRNTDIVSLDRVRQVRKVFQSAMGYLSSTELKIPAYLNSQAGSSPGGSGSDPWELTLRPGREVCFANGTLWYIGVVKEIQKDGELKIDSESYPNSWVWRKTQETWTTTSAANGFHKGLAVTFKTGQNSHRGRVDRICSNGWTRIDSPDFPREWVWRRLTQLNVAN